MLSDITLSIVFLNFNRLDETRTTVEQLLAMREGRSDIEIIAVDNGSTDGTAEYLEQQGGIISILLPHNGGIAGYNPGFERASGEFILVLDDDSCPDGLASIDRALSILSKQPDVGLLAFRIESPDGQLQTSWHLPPTQVAGPSPFFIGCGFMIRRALFEKIGWYPGDFFLYQNEVDVSFKVRLQGFQIFYDPRCRAIHRGIPNNRPGWRRVFYPTRNTLWLLRRYYPQPHAAYLICSRLIIGLIRALSFNEVGNYGRAVIEGLTAPLQKDTLPATLRDDFLPFSRQNSIFHQLLNQFKSARQLFIFTGIRQNNPLSSQIISFEQLIKKNPRWLQFHPSIVPTQELLNGWNQSEWRGYQVWINRHSIRHVKDWERYSHEANSYKKPVRISIVTPVHNIEPQILYECILSVRTQTLSLLATFVSRRRLN